MLDRDFAFTLAEGKKAAVEDKIGWSQKCC